MTKMSFKLQEGKPELKKGEANSINLVHVFGSIEAYWLGNRKVRIFGNLTLFLPCLTSTKTSPRCLNGYRNLLLGLTRLVSDPSERQG